MFRIFINSVLWDLNFCNYLDVMKHKIKNLILALLLVGIVDQINGSHAVIEYESRGGLFYTTVDLDMSACQPKEGDTVAFYRDYKIVACDVIE